MDFALLIEAALGVSSDLLLQMQVSYNIQIARQDKTLSKRLAEVRKICAVL
jgi:plasmid maintenance system antidote protein VapI